MNKVMSKNPHCLYWQKHQLHYFYLVSSVKSGSGTWLVWVYYDKIDVAVSPCTKTELVLQKLKKIHARKVKNIFIRCDLVWVHIV